MNKSTLYTRLLLVVGIAVFINFLSIRFNLRADLTKDNRFTLSEGTKKIVSNLEDVVTIKAYVSSDVATVIDDFSRELFNNLEEYKELSNGNIEYVQIDPDLDNEEEVREAIEAGIQQQQSQQSQSGELNAKIFFFGLTIEFGDQKEVIPFLQPNSSIEYPISRAIKKLTFTDKPKVGFITGMGEANMQEFQYLTEELKINFEPIGINPSGEQAGLIDETAALMIVNPKDTFPPELINKLDAYVASGKSVFITYSNNSANVFGQNGMAGEVNHAIETWLAGKGISINEDLVHDLACYDPNPFMRGDEFFYFPNAQNFADHPISKGLDEMSMFLTSTVSYSGDKGTFTPLVFTSERSGTEPLPAMIGNRKNWTDNDFAQSNLPVAGLYEEGEGKILVVGCGDFLNLNQQTQNLLKFGNRDLVINALDWMAGSDDLTEARNKRVVFGKLDIPEDPAYYKYFNFLFPVILVLLYGLIRSRIRKNKKLKWQAMDINS